MDNKLNKSEITENLGIQQSNDITTDKQQEICTVLNGQLVDGLMFVIETSSYPLHISMYTESEKIGFLSTHDGIRCILGDNEIIHIPPQNPHQEGLQKYLNNHPDLDDKHEDILLRRSSIENNIELCRVMRLSTMSEEESAFEHDMETLGVIQATANLINTHLSTK